MQFLAFLEALAGIITPTNISEAIALVEKLITLAESSNTIANQPPK